MLRGVAYFAIIGLPLWGTCLRCRQTSVSYWPGARCPHCNPLPRGIARRHRMQWPRKWPRFIGRIYCGPAGWGFLWAIGKDKGQ